MMVDVTACLPAANLQAGENRLKSALDVRIPRTLDLA